jgi:hypothetical protein
VKVAMSLLGVNLLGSTFVQDPNPLWLKINGVGVGESSQYGYSTANSNGDIGGLLNNLAADSNVVCVIYNWTTGAAYIKSGFNMSSSADSRLIPGYTTFVLKSKISKFYSPVTPTPAPVPVKSKVMIAPYCMPGSDTMRATFGLNWKPCFTLAFWNGSYWDSGEPDASLISEIRAKGGDCGISFGGEAGCSNGSEPALLGGTVQQVMQRYQAPIQQYNFTYIDFDIEGGAVADKASVDRRNQVGSKGGS